MKIKNKIADTLDLASVKITKTVVQGDWPHCPSLILGDTKLPKSIIEMQKRYIDEIIKEK